MKRICIVKLGHYPKITPLTRNAETLLSQGYQVDVLCLREMGEKAREVIGGVKVYRLPGAHHRRGVLRYFWEYGYFFIAASLTLSWLSLKKRYDVIEVDTMPDFLVFATLFPRLLGSKVILYMFENMTQLFTSTYKKDIGHIGAKLLRFIEKQSVGYAHRVIVADGIPYKQHLESRGVPSEKLTVVLNVPNEERFKIKSQTLADNGNHFRVMVVSAIIERYGVQTLIRAVPLLLPNIPQLKVDVVGQGEYLPVLKKLACDLEVESYVNFTGYIPDDEMVSYMARADITVAPMIDDVGHPIKIFEYFALGKPTVASAHPPLLATFNTDCLLYFQPGDERDLAAQILELYYSPEKRATLAANAQAFYQGCRWPAMKREYLKVYEQLLNHESRSK
jgi:glycosyltransferase involved in cell wall biosynthesis